MSDSTWFELPVRAQPHHTDYGGIVWHGHYLTWLETARVEALHLAGVPLEACVAAHVNLIVADVALRYRRPVLMGEAIAVLARPLAPQGVRLPWDYEIRSRDRQHLHLTATVRLAAVNPAGTPYRRLPPLVRHLYEQFESLLAEGDVPLG